MKASGGVVASSITSQAKYKTVLGMASSQTSGTTLTIFISAAIAIGDLVLVYVACDNLTASTPTISATDSGGNAYTNHGQGGVNATAGAGVIGAILGAKATVAVASGGSITLTFSGAIVAKAAYADSWIGFDNITRQAVSTATGATTTPSIAGSANNTPGDLIVGVCAIESRTAPTVYDTDTLNGAWSSASLAASDTVAADASCVEVVRQYKYPNTSGAQTYNLTLGAATEWVAMTTIFQRTLPISDTAPYFNMSWGSINVPDPVVMPTEYTFKAKVVGPNNTTATDMLVVQQGSADPNMSFSFYRRSSTGTLSNRIYPTGMTATTTTVGSGNIPIQRASILYFACSFQHVVGGLSNWRNWISYDDGVTWLSSSGTAWVGTNAEVAPPYNSVSNVTIGTFSWVGRVYWVELVTGIDPHAGTRLWRCDASDHVSGTTWTDARGHTWTLANVRSVVKP